MKKLGSIKTLHFIREYIYQEKSGRIIERTFYDSRMISVIDFPIKPYISILPDHIRTKAKLLGIVEDVI